MTTSETIEILKQAEQDAKDQKLDIAVSGFQYYLTMEPASIRGWKGLFCSLKIQERYEEALETAQTLVILNPQDGSSFADLADILSRVKRYEEAAQAITHSISLNPDYPLSYVLAHIIHDEMGNDAIALAFLEQAIAKFPDDSRIYATLGMYAEKRNLLEEALYHFQSAWSRNYLDLKFLSTIGRLLLSLGRIDDARKTWEIIADQESLVQSAKRNLRKYKPETKQSTKMR